MDFEKTYLEIKKKVQHLIALAETRRETYHLIAIFDTPGELDALSGIVYPIEIENIETGFACVTKNYTGYNNASRFLGDILTGKFRTQQDLDYLVYSTAQMGTGANRRLLIPLVCEQLGFLNLSCDAYTLGLLQNKAHHFHLLSRFFKTPETYVYQGGDIPAIPVQGSQMVLKPALECAATGVVKVENTSDDLRDKLQNMREVYRQDILVQEFINGYEVCVPVINMGTDYIALPPVWVRFEGDILTFDAVDKVRYSMTALPDPEFPMNHLIPKMLDNSQRIMSFLGTRGITRIDYRVTAQGELYAIDIAALPVLAHTGTCQVSFSTLFSENQHSIFQTLIGIGLFSLPNN